MANGKWIEGLRADMPVEMAARIVLTARLSAVQEHLPLAVERAEEDIEYVHQLRVATRRSAAALRIFASCLPGKSAKRARRQLRDLRRSAGAARDWDVFQEDLGPRLKKQTASMDFVSGAALGSRVAAQKELQQAAQHLNLEELISRLLDSLTPPIDKSNALADWAVPIVKDRLEDFNQTARGDLTDFAHLHQVRIAGKQLRYAIEILECCFDASLRESVYPVIEDMQEILGLANDSHVAAQWLQSLRQQLSALNGKLQGRYHDGVQTLLRSHQRRLVTQRRHFLKWWKDWQESGTEATLRRLVG